jgi:hypothetical protein
VFNFGHFFLRRRELPPHIPQPPLSDLTIRLNKYILQTSKTLFLCNSCLPSTITSAMTILTVLCQNVISSYEHVLCLLARQYYKLHKTGDEHVPGWLKVYDSEVEGGEGEEERRIQLREYEVDKSEELCLFSGLETLQLGILRPFLFRFKAAPEKLVGDYFTLLDSVDKRVMKLGSFCSDSC